MKEAVLVGLCTEQLCLLFLMQGLAALLFPAVLMLFALAMEKVQSGIDRLTVSEENVEDFLETAGPENVNTLAREGFPAAMDELRTRRELLEPELPTFESSAKSLESFPKRAS